MFKLQKSFIKPIQPPFLAKLTISKLTTGVRARFLKGIQVDQKSF